MANIDLAWDVEGILTPQESVEQMLKVVESKTLSDSGTFWTWEGKASHSTIHSTLARQLY